MAALAATARAAPTVTAYSAPFDPPTIDGRLDEAVWRQAPRTTAFVQDEPIEGAPPSEKTEVMVAVGAGSLYVGARLHEKDARLVAARLGRRDHDVVSDHFAVFLDPHRDRRSGVYFAVNAAGTQYDGTLSNDDAEDNSWDGVWESAVKRDQAGWQVELRIPLSQLRFDASAGRRWGINFKRFIARNNEDDFLVPTPRTASGFVSRFAELAGVEVLTAPARFEATPYFSSGVRYLEGEAGDPFAGDRLVRPRAGVDLKLGIGGHLTLDATLLPDFGQVEVDPAVINLSDLETFYPEKRPFFTEGASIMGDFGRGGVSSIFGFNWPQLELFYSRRIGRAPQANLPDEVEFDDTPSATEILGASKLTGKVGAWSVAALAAVTSSAHARVRRKGETETTRLMVEPFSAYGLVRGQRTLAGGRHALGAIATAVGRDVGEAGLGAELSKSALSGGLDGWLTLDRDGTYVLSGWAAASQISGSPARITAAQRSSTRYFQRPDATHLGVDERATSLSGGAGRVILNKQHGDVILNVGAGGVSPGFESNDVGFLSHTDRVNLHVAPGYRFTQPGKVFRYVGVIGAWFGNWDFAGTRLGQGYYLSSDQQWLNFWRTAFTVMHFPVGVDTRRTRGGPATIATGGQLYEAHLDTDLEKRYNGGVWFGLDRMDRGADRGWNVGGFVEAELTDRLQLELSTKFERGRTVAQYLKTEDDATATATYGKRYLFGDLYQRTLSAELRASFILTPRVSFELYLQPLVSALRYKSVRALAAPGSFDFVPTGRDPRAEDETVVSLRGSAVFRWEYLPGSTFFLVWNGNQSVEHQEEASFHVGRRLRSIAELPPNHVFLAKLSYWWGL